MEDKDDYILIFKGQKSLMHHNNKVPSVRRKLRFETNKKKNVFGNSTLNQSSFKIISRFNKISKPSKNVLELCDYQ